MNAGGGVAINHRAAPHDVDVERADHVRARILITLVWAWFVVPQVIQSVTTPQHQESVEVATSLSFFASLARMALTLALGGMALWVIVTSVRSAARLRPFPLVVLLMPWAYMVVRDWYIGGRPGFAGLLIPLIAVSFWLLQPRLSCLSTLGYLTAAGAALSIAMAVINPASAIFQSTDGDAVATDKQILPWGMLSGFLTHPNTLGMVLALGLSSTLLIPRRKHRIVAVSLCLFALVWSASRTSLEAAAVMCATAIALTFAPTGRSRKMVGAAAVLGSMAIVCILPFLSTDPTAFTNRSFIWQSSLPYWHAKPWFGQGSDFYDKIATTSSAIAGAVFTAHNQLVQFLVTGGLIYVAIAGAALWLAAACACRQASFGSRFGVTYLITLAGVFTLEVSFPEVGSTTAFLTVLVPLAVIIFSRDNITRCQTVDSVEERRNSEFRSDRPERQPLTPSGVARSQRHARLEI